MYLSAGFSHSIFVSVKKKRHPLKFPKKHTKAVLGAICLLLAFPSARGQQIHPGDVSGNGFVDQMDVLFWAYARGAQGAPRPNASSDFEAQDVDLTGWSGSFPGSERSFAYADCNGDGVVNYADRLVIEYNYNNTIGGVIPPDQFQDGTADISSQLNLGENAFVDVTPGELATFPLNLATYGMQDLEVGYMALRLNYGDTPIAEDSDGEPQLGINFDIEGNEWITGASEGVDVFLYHRPELGYSDVVLYMSSPGDYVVGKGAIAEFSIVVEEVIFGLQVININLPVILNSDFRRDGFTSGYGITLNVVGKPVSTDEGMLPEEAITVFPNPVYSGVLHVQLQSEHKGVIEEMQLFDQTGRLLISQQTNARNGQLDASALPQWLYLLKIKTDKSVQTIKVQATR
jgi:hypothetical protein